MTRLAVLDSNNPGFLKTDFLDIAEEISEVTRPKKLKLRNTTTSSTVTAAAQTEKSLLKKDVFWQTSEPVNFQENMDYFLSSLMINEQFSFSDDFLNELDLTQTTATTTSRQDFTAQQPAYTTFPIVDTTSHHHHQQAFDSVSNTSDDSLGSMESVEESYNMLSTPNFQNQRHKESYTSKPPAYNYSEMMTQQKQQFQQMNNKTMLNNTQSKTITRGSAAARQISSRRKSGAASKRKIDPVYNNDPYLQRHRLLVNARQKNRMMKINNMYTMLNSLIPEHVMCEANVKPHSKLGILKRAIVYWNSLASTLSAMGENTSEAEDDKTSTSSFLETTQIKKEEQPLDSTAFCLMDTVNNLSN